MSKNLFAGEKELIDLVINNNGDNDLEKDVAPEEFINNVIIFDSHPEISEMNHHGVNLKVKF